MKIFLTILVSCIAIGAFANTGENDSVTIKGIVVDEHKEPLISAVLQIENNKGETFMGNITDADGYYTLTFPQVKTAAYPLTITAKYVGYKSVSKQLISERQLSDSIVFTMKERVEIGCPIYRTYTTPLIDPYSGGNHKTITSEEIERGAFR